MSSPTPPDPLPQSPTRERFQCQGWDDGAPGCGLTTADEDGACIYCGADTIVVQIAEPTAEAPSQETPREAAMTLTRYDVNFDIAEEDGGILMGRPDSRGEWVNFDEALAVVVNLKKQLAELTKELDALRERERQLHEWATAERDDWSERNADRYWQMNQVVARIKEAYQRSQLQPDLPQPEKERS